MEKQPTCSFDNLDYDEACVTLKSEINLPNLWLYALSSDCIDCPYTKIARLKQSQVPEIKINTAKLQNWRVYETDKHEDYISASNKKGLYCEFSPKLGEFGTYVLTADQNNICDFRTKKQPYNTVLPLVIALGSIILLLGSLYILKIISRRIKKCWTRNEQNQRVNNLLHKQRLRSLDTVRGMSILLMIFVNNGSGGYLFLEHATWNGLYVGDLVFPCFMWIMGVCIPLSISSQISRGASRFFVCWSIVKRSFYLFLIGISINTLGGKIDLEYIRIFGVLQRFSVCYLVTAIIYALLIPKNTKFFKHSALKSIHDILILIPQWSFALLFLACHCATIFLLPVPNCPTGYLGPGGRHADGKYWNCTGGATGYIDKVLLGVNHIYQFPTVNSVYGSGAFDPEGILGCLSSIFQVFLGVQAGQIIREFKDWKSRFFRWLLWALLFGVVGLTLHYTNVIPVNKNLWSVSFVMISTSFSLGLLSVCYLLIDVIDVWEGGPFRIPGMNALAMYVGHQVFYETFPFHWKIGKMNTHSWLLAESLWCVAVWTCIAYILHGKKFYLTL